MPKFLDSNRLKEVRIFLNYKKQAQFADFLGIQRVALTNIENGKRAISKDIIEKLVTKCNVNGHWLLTGEGEMFISEPVQVGEDATQVLRVESEIAAGQPVEASTSPLDYLIIGTSVIPDVNKVYCFSVNGYSMEPDVCHGDLVVIRKRNEWTGVEGKICAVKVNGEITLKRIAYDYTKKIIFLLSSNKDYTPIIVDPKHDPIQLIGILDTIIRKY